MKKIEFPIHKISKFGHIEIKIVFFDHFKIAELTASSLTEND